MECVRTILVVSDRSGHACHAESRAEILCSGLAATGVHDVKQDQCKVEAASLSDTPAAIVERANETGAGLIVVAPRRENFLAGLVARFRIDELIRLSDRPVLLINREPAAAYRKVLVAVDFSAESEQAARVALALAPGAAFTFLHVFRVANEEMMIGHGVATDTIHDYRIRARETARVRLNGFIESLGPRTQLLYRAIEHGVPGPVIQAYAREINADLIVAGKHGKSRFIELFLGSVTQRLLDGDDRDLLVSMRNAHGKSHD